MCIVQGEVREFRVQDLGVFREMIWQISLKIRKPRSHPQPPQQHFEGFGIRV